MAGGLRGKSDGFEGARLSRDPAGSEKIRKTGHAKARDDLAADFVLDSGREDVGAAAADARKARGGLRLRYRVREGCMAEEITALWQEAEQHLRAFEQLARRTVEEAWLAGYAPLRIKQQLPHGPGRQH